MLAELVAKLIGKGEVAIGPSFLPSRQNIRYFGGNVFLGHHS